MKEKLKSKKFWITLLSDIISVTVIFEQIGGTIGIIAAIIATLASSISYVISECKLDRDHIKATYEEVTMLISELKKKEGE